MAVLVAGLAGVAWMFTGPVPGDAVIGNARVIGALAGMAAGGIVPVR